MNKLFYEGSGVDTGCYIETVQDIGSYNFRAKKWRESKQQRERERQRDRETERGEREREKKEEEEEKKQTETDRQRLVLICSILNVSALKRGADKYSLVSLQLMQIQYLLYFSMFPWQ